MTGSDNPPKPALIVAERLLTGIAFRICAICLWAVVALLGFAALERNLLGTYYMFHGDEIIGYLMAALFLLGIPIALLDGAHVRIDTLYRRVPAEGKRVLRPIFRLLSIVSGILLAAGGMALMADSIRTGRMHYGMVDLPVWVPQMLVMAGGIALVLASLIMSDAKIDETIEQ